jgi:hypothetical protein
MNIDFSELDSLSEAEFCKLEIAVDKLLAVWHIKSAIANDDNWHDDQRIGQKRRKGGWPRTYLSGSGLSKLPVPPPPPPPATSGPQLPPIEALEGNALIHGSATWIFEFNDDATMVRILYWTFGIEGLSQEREKPAAVVSMMRCATTMARVNGTWQTCGSSIFSRTTKNDNPKDWVHHMRPTATRPPMSYEDDLKRIGKYAYRPFEIRACVPAAPERDTWQEYPDFRDAGWAMAYLSDQDTSRP